MGEAHIYASIRELIAKDKMTAAIKALREIVSSSDQLDAVIAQSGRYNNILHHFRQGTQTTDQTSAQLNQFRLDLLQLLQEMEHGIEGAPTPIQEVANQPQIIQNAEKIYNIDHIDNANFS